MRILTPNEQRQVEQFRDEVVKMPDDGIELFIPLTERELWLNILDMVLQTQDAMKAAWQKSDNPVINLRG